MDKEQHSKDGGSVETNEEEKKLDWKGPDNKTYSTGKVDENTWIEMLNNAGFYNKPKKNNN